MKVAECNESDSLHSLYLGKRYQMPIIRCAIPGMKWYGTKGSCNWNWLQSEYEYCAANKAKLNLTLQKRHMI